ncbi:MAG: carbamoyltransferase HypF [Nitrosomonas sp.]|nr:MAG: carbamoyltransferase HypF [Nitrosomonas sp.]
MVNIPVDTEIPLATDGPAVLACGAWLKNTVCLTQGDRAYIAPLIGDLATADACNRLDQTVRRMLQQYPDKPRIVAHDLHPDFYSTRLAQRIADEYRIPGLAVQHHHAHIAAVCAEHGVIQPMLGLALDGIGLGTDRMPWGGELLWVDGTRFERLSHLAALALPGSDRAAREPWRMAAAALFRLNRRDEITDRYADQPAAATVAAMLDSGLNCPYTSSMGRLFDAAAGLLRINLVQVHEAQAAIQLQQLAEQHGTVAPLTGGYQFTGTGELDFAPLLAALIDCHDSGRDTAYAAALFHATLADGLATWLEYTAQQQQLSLLAFGGGCFHNTLLRRGLLDRLSPSGLQLLFPQRLPPDDSAIALGQAWIARQYHPEEPGACGQCQHQ